MPVLFTESFPQAAAYSRWAAQRAYIIRGIALSSPVRANRLDDAYQRARAALVSLLDEENERTLAEHGYVSVTGSRGGRFRLYTSTPNGNIVVCDSEGHPEHVVCAHPFLYDRGLDAYLPTDCAVIAQMLALRTNEDAVLEVAAYHIPFRGFLFGEGDGWPW